MLNICDMPTTIDQLSLVIFATRPTNISSEQNVQIIGGPNPCFVRILHYVLHYAAPILYGRRSGLEQLRRIRQSAGKL